MADIRNPTCSKHEFLPPICFSKDQGFPGHSAFCLTTVDILCTRLKSPTFFSALPCRICRFKLTWSSRCNKTTSVCLFLFNGCFMEWPNVLSLRWHVICDVFFALFWFWGKKCDDTTICFTFSISSIQKEMYKKLYASARLLTICNALGWSLSVGYTTKLLHPGTPSRTTQAEIFMVLMAYV